ncbi:SDR family oxidoreductase [Fimbriiglobus ruber]|nr:SDR family oxidoreductase [Fimbriiglobus ruber]
MRELCLVTGGAGFIGSHLVEALLAAGHPVRVLDDLSTGRASNLAHMSPAPELIRGSVTDPVVVERAVKGVGVVFHLAAVASVARSLEDPLHCHGVCATGTLNVLDAARKHGVRRIVYAASSSAYGPASDPAGQDEDTPLQPLSPYAAAKLAGEHYLASFAASYGTETVRLRFFNIFGPRQRADSPYSGVIAIFTGMMSEGRAPAIHGDGLQTRDFVYVTNAVQALIKAAHAKGVSGQVYNVGTGKSVTLLDLVAALNKTLGTHLTPTHGPARVGDVRYSLAKIARIRTALGYEPTVSFEEGISRTVEWYRSGIR